MRVFGGDAPPGVCQSLSDAPTRDVNSLYLLSPPVTGTNRTGVAAASAAALAALLAWWGGVAWLDGVLAANPPYRRYETVALPYPDVFYPGVPGLVLAHAQPFYVGYYVALVGGVVGLAVAFVLAAAVEAVAAVVG